MPRKRKAARAFRITHEDGNPLRPWPKTHHLIGEAVAKATIDQLVAEAAVVQATPETKQNHWRRFNMEHLVQEELKNRFHDQLNGALTKAEISEWGERLNDPSYVQKAVEYRNRPAWLN